MFIFRVKHVCFYLEELSFFEYVRFIFTSSYLCNSGVRHMLCCVSVCLFSSCVPMFSNAYLTYLFVNNTCARHAGANTALKTNYKMWH